MLLKLTEIVMLANPTIGLCLKKRLAKSRDDCIQNATLSLA